MYLALYARRAWVIFDHPYNAEYEREDHQARALPGMRILADSVSGRAGHRRPRPRYYRGYDTLRAHFGELHVVLAVSEGYARPPQLIHSRWSSRQALS